VFEELPRHAADFSDFAACMRGDHSFAYAKAHDLSVQEVVLKASGMPLT